MKVTLYSSQHLSDTEFNENLDQILIPKDVWEEWIDDDEGLEVSLCRLSEGGPVVTVGGYHELGEGCIICPLWVFQIYREYNEVELIRLKEMPPVATNLRLKPVDSAVLQTDYVEALSELLSGWQVITKGTIITVTLKEMGGYCVDFFVEDVQGGEDYEGDCVLLRGELPFELSDSLETVPDWPMVAQKSLAEASSSKEADEEEDFSCMLPSLTVPQSQTFKPFTGKYNKLI